MGADGQVKGQEQTLLPCLQEQEIRVPNPLLGMRGAFVNIVNAVTLLRKTKYLGTEYCEDKGRIWLILLKEGRAQGKV